MVRISRQLQAGAAVLIALLLVSVDSHAQPAGGKSVRVLSLKVGAYPEVSVSVAVVDETGNPVQGLGAGNFQITEDGQRADILDCAPARPDQQQLAMVLAMDTSGSMKGKPIEAARRAALDLISRLGPEDRCEVVGFSTKVAEIARCAGKDTSKAATVDNLRAGGNTALYDAVAQSAERVAGMSADRRAVVVLTDGRDTASRTKRSEAVSRAQEVGISLYLVGLGPKCDRAVLGDLATATGGAAYFATSPEELVDLYRRVLDQVRCFYEVKYRVPEEAPGGTWQRFRVEASGGGVTGADEGRYLVPTLFVAHTGLAEWLRANVLLLGVGALCLVNLVLAAVVIRRRHAGG